MTSQAEATSTRRELAEAALMLRGHSPAMDAVRARLRLAACARGSVLFVGKTGTGKGLVARFVHEASCGREAPLVSVFCPALSREPLDWEPVLAQAAGGSLLLDEVSELPSRDQGTFLTALRGRGEGSDSVRLLSTTRVDLAALVRRGEFREELYVRLAAMRVEVPTLRGRLGDLPELTEVLLARVAARGTSAMPARPRLTPGAIAALASHEWPGNVRELENVLERLVIASRDEPIDVELVRAALAARHLRMNIEWTPPPLR